MRVLVSGKNGFLMRNVLKDYDWEVTTLLDGGIHVERDLIIHFASPSDKYDFENLERLVNANINLTISAVAESNRNNCKLIFASSRAVEEDENNYAVLKKAAELYIQVNCKDYVILRIPRVYGKNKNKGLMKQIRLNEINNEDWDKEIEYIDIEDFKKWFKEILTKNGIQYYNKQKRKNTIAELKELYV